MKCGKQVDCGDEYGLKFHSFEEGMPDQMRWWAEFSFRHVFKYRGKPNYSRIIANIAPSPTPLLDGLKGMKGMYLGNG